MIRINRSISAIIGIVVLFLTVFDYPLNGADNWGWIEAKTLRFCRE